MNEPIINYLNDTIKQLIESAKNLTDRNDFDKGVRIEFYQTISLLLNQSVAFGIYEKLDKEIKEFNIESLI